MTLTKYILPDLLNSKVSIPHDHTFSLPEKVLQFGTGVLLRGLPDFFINQANQQGIFNGRVVVVKSTSGNVDEFQNQDNLYTLCIRGIENGELVSENLISSAISRVLSAHHQWQEILKVAESDELELIVSNTTEVGISWLEERLSEKSPTSFPGKVLAVLYQRFKAFEGNPEKGLVIIATELIPDNGKLLADLVNRLAIFNQLEDEFIEWLNKANTFCSSLVDRIVPGKPDQETLKQIEEELGYQDSLLTMAEPYRLWAIEGNEKVKELLSFGKVDAGIIVAPDIEIYRELKVRLLNGTHTLSSAIAYLSGIKMVKNAMDDDHISSYIEKLMIDEISNDIPYAVTKQQTEDFYKTVIDRFSNPSIEHLWHNITFQYTMKMKVRVLPLIINHYRKNLEVPELMAFGFAAYLKFMDVVQVVDGKYYGKLNSDLYLINDDSAKYFYDAKMSTADVELINQILSDNEFWGWEIDQMPGFIDTVTRYYDLIVEKGMPTAVRQLLLTKENVCKE